MRVINVLGFSIFQVAESSWAQLIMCILGTLIQLC